MVELKHISKYRNTAYGNVGTCIFEDVSLSVTAGQMVCISGASGVGKTTILEIIAGLLDPDSGERVVGTTRIGYGFQDDRLMPWATVFDNLFFVAKSYFPKREVSNVVNYWLSEFGLSSYSKSMCSELSGGMKRRLNLARAFAIAPELLLLDEPFAFQDEIYQKKIVILIKTFVSEKGVPVVLVEHGDLLSQHSEIRNLDSRSIVMP